MEEIAFFKPSIDEAETALIKEALKEHGSVIVDRLGADAAFHVNLRAFAQVLSGNFGQPVIEHQAVPLGVLAHFAALAVFPAFGGCQGDIGHLAAVGEGAHFPH